MIMMHDKMQIIFLNTLRVTLGTPSPSRPHHHLPHGLLSLSPLPVATAEPQGRRPKAAGALCPPPLFPRSGGRRGGPLCPKPPPLKSIC